MNKQLVRITIVVLSVMLLLPLMVCQAEETEVFSGTRSVIFVADVSDLSNFISGGRSTLDIALRAYLPEFASCVIKGSGRQVKITLSYDFSSFEDYKQKTQELLTYPSQNIEFDDSIGVSLREGHKACELLNTVADALVSADCIYEFSLIDILRVEKNSIVLNGVEYTAESDVLVVLTGDEDQVTLLEALDVVTEFESNGTVTRTITAQVDAGSQGEEAYNELRDRFLKYGEISNEASDGDMRTIVAKLSASNESDLVYQTMRCLLVTASVNETMRYSANNNILVNRVESLEAEKILSKGGTYTNSVILPEYCTNITAISTNLNIDDRSISYSNMSTAMYTYNQNFCFSKIVIDTDLTSGIAKRTITFYAPLNIAKHFRESIEEQMSSRMYKDSTFEVNDENGILTYKYIYMSRSDADIERFTKAVSNGECNITSIKSSLMQTIYERTDSYNFSNVLENTAPSKNIVAIYHIKPGSKIIEMSNAQLDDNMLTFGVDSIDNTYFSYKSINVTAIILTVIGGLLVMLIAFLMIFREATLRKARKLYSSLKVSNDSDLNV